MLEVGVHYFVKNHDGLLVGACFQNGTLGPLGFFQMQRPTLQLQFSHALSAASIQRLHQQPVSLWYELVSNARQQSCVALLRCRYNPCHRQQNHTATIGKGQVGV